MLETNHSKIYFPNLNGLRFIAALMVVISHIELFKKYYSIPNLYDNPELKYLGKLGVMLFFVLSGFLITNLLIIEKKNFNTIKIKNFYLRRIYKIWPIYFLISFIGFCILPYIEIFSVPNLMQSFFTGFKLKVICQLFFLPYAAPILYAFMPYTFQTWSIGIEEQFYLFVPILIKKAKNLISILFIILFINLLIKYLSVIYYYKYPGIFSYYLYSFAITISFGGMLFGSITALIYQNNYYKILSVLYNKYLLFSSCLLFIYFYLKYSIYFTWYYDEIYALFYSIIILNLATNQKFKLLLEYKFFNYLGKISYSTYMIHNIAIAVVFNILSRLNCMNNLMLYTLTILLIYLLSALMYKLIETPFLKIKEKYIS